MYKIEFELAFTDEAVIAAQDFNSFSILQLKYAVTGCEDHHNLEYTIFWRPEPPEFETTPDMCNSVAYHFHYRDGRGLTLQGHSQKGMMLDATTFHVNVELPKTLVPNDSSMPKLNLWATDEFKGHILNRLTSLKLPDRTFADGVVQTWGFSYFTNIVDPEILSKFARRLPVEGIEIPGIPFIDPHLVKIPITYGLADCPPRQMELELDLKAV